MQSALLQDLTTVTGAARAQLVQTASNWLDIGDLEDLTFFLDVRDASGSGATLTYETSPTALDSEFVSLLQSPITLASGLRSDVVVASIANIPPARFVRWHIQGSAFGSWSVTFRIWLAGYGWA